MHFKSVWQKFVSAGHRFQPNWQIFIKKCLPYVLVAVLASATVFVALGVQNSELGFASASGEQTGSLSEKQELELKLKELETALATTNDLLEKLSATGASTQTLLDEAGAISDKIEELKDVYAKLEQQEQQRWVVPMQYTVVTSPYGYRDHPVAGEAKFHYGVDMAAALGTPIVATRSGTVEIATYDDQSGNYVYINHMDGFGSSYMHMDRSIVKQGQFVMTGQVIGYCGSSGASTGVHLHFEVYKDHVMVDPADYIDFY